MNKINIIFLDIDGVVNNDETKEKFHGYYGIDNQLFYLFCQILYKTKSNPIPTKVVLSSTWRIEDKSCVNVVNHFVDFGFYDAIIGRTPVFPFDYGRGQEIKKWVIDNKSIINKYVILDDDLNAIDGIIKDKDKDKNIPCKFITTMEKYGITSRDVINVIDFFNH